MRVGVCPSRNCARRRLYSHGQLTILNRLLIEDAALDGHLLQEPPELYSVGREFRRGDPSKKSPRKPKGNRDWAVEKSALTAADHVRR